MNSITLKLIREREQEPGLDDAANARMDIVRARLSPNVEKMEKLAQQAKQETTPSRKYDKVLEVANMVGAALEGVAACKTGCSQCCHILVSLSQAEANIIGERIGRTVATPNYDKSRFPDYSRTGKPCQFLKDNLCSIYENRPLACRLCYNMDRDNLLCTLIEGESINVPYFDGVQFELLFANAMGFAEAIKLGGLQDFFPENQETTK